MGEMPVVERGDVIRWKNIGIGNGFCTSRLIAWHSKKWFKAPYWEAQTLVEPFGFPKEGTPYELSALEGKLTEEQLKYVFGYGVLIAIHRPTPEGMKQVFPEVSHD